jgi:hypothetical protein
MILTNFLITLFSGTYVVAAPLDLCLEASEAPTDFKHTEGHSFTALGFLLTVTYREAHRGPQLFSVGLSSCSSCLQQSDRHLFVVLEIINQTRSRSMKLRSVQVYALYLDSSCL